MVVIDANAIHHHPAVVVVLDTTDITRLAVVHARQLHHLALVAEAELAIVLHFKVYVRVGLEIVLKYELIKFIFKKLLPFYFHCYIKFASTI